MSELHVHPASNSLRRSSDDIKSSLITSSIETCLDAFNSAREIVRLIQCKECSKPLSNPITLPCGNSICRGCLPPVHVRQNISYPATANRLEGFTCPFRKCGKDHAVGDTSLDVTMAKVMTVIESQMEEFGQRPSGTSILLQEVDGLQYQGLPSTAVNTRVLPGGRLFATYVMANAGELHYRSDLDYTNVAEKSDDITLQAVDSALLDALKEETRQELDCQVCYALLLDPLTTPCGHTFCRKCIHRVLDHSSLCPICRRTLSLPSAVSTSEAPSNKRLIAILDALCPSQMAARKEFEEQSAQKLNDLDVPLFVCTLSFPSMPTYLHIFEPRYRLMIRRAMENENRRFGMVMFNPSQEAQGDLGPVNFYQYGTMLQIVNYQSMPDGRSLIETVGLGRFRVIRSGQLDGYTISKVERVDDVSLAEEEELEARDVSTPVVRSEEERDRFFASNRHFGGPPSASLGSNTLDSLNPGGLNRITFSQTDLRSLPTSDLLKISSDFVARMRDSSAPWLHQRVIAAYGPPPLQSPTNFPWWLATVLPVAESEKYKLLSSTSVRERLRICAGWCLAWEQEKSEGRGGSCSVL